MCRLYDEDTYWLVCYDARYYKIIKHHQHALVVNKKNMINHTLAVVFFVCAEKSHVALISCCIFYWLDSERGSYQQTHCVMIMLYRRLSLVAKTVTTAVFEPLSLYDTGPPIRRHDHRNGYDCFMMPIFRLGQPTVCLGLYRVADLS